MKKMALLFFICLNLQAQDGSLDTSFNGNGKLVFAHPDNLAVSPSIESIAVQPDGKIVAVGDNRLVVRLNTDGSFDSTFDTDGKLLLNDFRDIFSVKILPDGKILVAGVGTTKFVITGPNYNCFGIARLNSNGTLDTSFDTDGYLPITFYFGKESLAYDFIVQPDNKIVVVGNTEVAVSIGDDCAVARINPDGTLDTTFGNGTGKVVFSLTSYDYLYGVDLQSDGKIVAVGKYDTGSTSKDSLVIRLNPDGTFDSTFDGDGMLDLNVIPSIDYFNDVKIQSDGKIVACGMALTGSFSSGQWSLVRLNSDGSYDTSFDGDGLASLSLSAWGGDVAHEILLQPDGKIVVGGMGVPSTSPVYSIARFNSNGSLDTTFGTAGKISNVFTASSHCKAIAFQPDGKIIAGGLLMNATYNLVFSRHLNSITLSSQSFDKSAFKIFPNPSKGILNITTETENIGARVEVHNILGQKIKSFELLQLENQVQLDKGLYLLTITKNNSKSTYKVIVE